MPPPLNRDRERDHRDQRQRFNEQIRISPIRVIDENGEMLGVMPTAEALQRAREAGLDLVEVAPTERPPVCRIMDYGKFKYQQSKNAHKKQAGTHVSEMKELWMGPNTEAHDRDVKTKQARNFLERGDRVQMTVRFKGGQMRHQENGRELLAQIKNDLADIAKVERDIKMEGRRMTVLFAPLRSPVVKHNTDKPDKSAKTGGLDSGHSKLSTMPAVLASTPATPVPATGSSATGSSATGSSATGSSATGSSAAGSPSASPATTAGSTTSAPSATPASAVSSGTSMTASALAETSTAPTSAPVETPASPPLTPPNQTASSPPKPTANPATAPASSTATVVSKPLGGLPNAKPATASSPPATASSPPATASSPPATASSPPATASPSSKPAGTTPVTAIVPPKSATAPVSAKPPSASPATRPASNPGAAATSGTTSPSARKSNALPPSRPSNGPAVPTGSKPTTRGE